MCGIAGVVAWDDRYRTSRETLAKMSAAIAHRGPDGEGIYFNHEDEATSERPQCALAHRRLAIIDPDPRSNEPFPSADRSKWLVFNGEIYNYRELRAELSKLRPGYEWRTTGDTEVLMVAYEQWAEKCVEHFNGMFAFAIWDDLEKSLFLARDRMGQKPVYLALGYCAPTVPSVAFASELGALCAVGWIGPHIDEGALSNYLALGYVGNESTIYSGAQRLSPGMWRRFRFRRQDGDFYFSPNEPVNLEGERIALTRSLVSLAVRRQMVSDVPVGCLLSGGIDSSVIASAMKHAGGDVTTFSIRFDHPRYDESAFAAAVAAHLGTKHHCFEVTPEAAADLPKLAAVFGEPFGDSSALPTHYLARETRGYVKVALSGDGGDELFGGYDRYRAMNLDRFLRRIPRGVRAMIPEVVNEQLPTGHPKSAGNRMRRFLLSAHLEAPERYESYLRLFHPWQVSELLGRVDSRRPIAKLFEALLRDRQAVEAALAVDRWTYLPDDLLIKLDRASMLHNLEVRSPFMDHELVQFASGLTSDQLLRGGPKRMLREAFADDLPAWVFKRKKMGFAVPIGEWFRSSLRPMLHDNLFASDSFGATHFNMAVVRRMVEEHEQERVDHSQRVYALLMLELWWKSTKN